jgi:hypothetical protein
MGLVELLYEQYDQDKDKNINMNEWISFANDIVDEADPLYAEIVN